MLLDEFASTALLMSWALSRTTTTGESLHGHYVTAKQALPWPQAGLQLYGLLQALPEHNRPQLRVLASLQMPSRTCLKLPLLLFVDAAPAGATKASLQFTKQHPDCLNKQRYHKFAESSTPAQELQPLPLFPDLIQAPMTHLQSGAASHRPACAQHLKDLNRTSINQSHFTPAAL